MCRQKGNSHIKYLESTFFRPFLLEILRVLLQGAAPTTSSSISRSEFEPESHKGEKTVLTIDCDFQCFGVGRGDVIKSAAFVVSGLVPRDAIDVQMFAAVILPAWKQKRGHLQGSDSGYVAVV